MRYVYYITPGHGWLQVPRAEINNLGIAQKISGFSMQHGPFVYLEEDEDMAIFLAAKLGTELVSWTQYQHLIENRHVDSFGEDYHSYHPKGL